MFYLQIEDLPDELIFKVFSYFKINDLLIPCSLLSKRFRAIRLIHVVTRKKLCS